MLGVVVLPRELFCRRFQAGLLFVKKEKAFKRYILMKIVGVSSSLKFLYSNKKKRKSYSCPKVMKYFFWNIFNNYFKFCGLCSLKKKLMILASFFVQYQLYHLESFRHLEDYCANHHLSMRDGQKVRTQDRINKFKRWFLHR